MGAATFPRSLPEFVRMRMTYCEMLRQHLIQALPGYDEAPWGVEP
jgi:hypothetical protein